MKVFNNSFALLVIAALFSVSEASVFLPYTSSSASSSLSCRHAAATTMASTKKDLRWSLRQYKRNRNAASTAMAIPGYGVAEQVFVGGFANFLGIYNIIITARILLSWFPQAQGIGALQPVYAITDPYLNLFRGVIPPIFGLDFSPILAFFLLNLLSNATAAVGYELPPGAEQHSVFATKKRGVLSYMQQRKSSDKKAGPCLNY